ncbi:MAG TPA: peptide chain release factor N(5)-glutamine methyltransferase [Saprospiraceae bacterium]|nr:peptide chain release factor N(5)-glutamine methyltransferase [Saprospiraceae bacterium]
MTANQAYDFLCVKMEGHYDARESSIIARYLIEDLFSKSFHSDKLLNQSEVDVLENTALRLQKNEPWQYIGGVADFYGLKFNVNPSVLIPRPETEELAYLAIDIIKKYNISSVMDIGTGSGILPITIAKKAAIREVYGLDVSVGALETAKSNANLHEVQIQWIHSDILDRNLWSKLPKVEIIVSNPPYISRDEKVEMQANVLDYEPELALFVQNSPLEFYDAISDFVILFQDSGCKLLVEINEKYGKEVSKLFMDKGLKNIILLQDLQGKDRIVGAEK